LNNALPLAVCIAISFFCGALDARAQDGAPAPDHSAQTSLELTAAKAVIDDFHVHLIDIMKRSDKLGQSGRAEELYPVLNKSMNILALGIGAVGKRNWKSWEPAQQDQFIEVFLRFMAATYATRFKSFNGQEFIISGDRPGPKSSVIIMTEVHSKRRDAANIHYLMINRGNRWAVADIFLDGAISEVAMRRSEFSSILRNQGFDALIDAIQQKTADKSTS
jgi:phospholipid transport system substrate-binding protein